MFKNNKGISLVTMVMTVLVMLILLSTLTYSAYTSLEIRNLNKLYNDIRTLNDAVAVYYMENGSLPVSGEYATISVGETLDDNISFVTNDGTFINQDSLVNPNDYNEDTGVGQATYYTLDLGLFDNISLENDGQYIINEQSHTIFYVEGITVQGVTYHSLELNYIDIDSNLRNPIETVVTQDIYLPLGGTSLDLKDYMTFLDEDGNISIPRSIEYNVITAGYGNYFTIENDIITSATNVEAITTPFRIEAIISSYGTTATQTVTLEVYLTDIELVDSLYYNEISKINLVKGDAYTIYARKYGNAGTLSLIAKVEDGNGIDASISNTSSSSKNLYPISISATNTGKVYLTVLENNGRSAKEIEINVYDPYLDFTDISITSLNSTENLTLTIDERYEENPDSFEIIWSSSDYSIISIEENESNPLEISIIPQSYGSATIYCEIQIDGQTLTTLESNISVSGVTINDVQMQTGEKMTASYEIDSSITSSMISDIEITSSDTTILEVLENEITNEFEFSALKAGTSTVTITIRLTDGTEYTDTAQVSVSS